MREPACIHESFHLQAAATPDAACLIDDAGELSYAEVQRRVIRLAAELKQSGAQANSVVAIFMEPSVDYVVSMLAILTAGAGYVPLELAYPTTMLQKVLSDATPVAVVTKLEQRSQLPAAHTTMAVLCLDDAEHEYNHADDLESLLVLKNSWHQPTLDDLAFVVYSSGTTGQPKGIANPHRAPALSYQWRFHEISDYGVGDRVACNVFFVWEAVRPVMRGAAVVPVPASIVFDGDQLSKYLQKHKVTEMLFTPSLLENLLNTMSRADLQERLASLKTIFLNGEVVSMVLRERCYQTLPHVRFINLYSISECHEVGAVDLREIDLTLSTKYCPIGPPCSVSPAYVLDEESKLVEEGDAGELYVGGDMLAIGYLNLPELTDSRFVPDPFGAGHSRMYRTGDRARMLPNGHLEILGRCDFMVKIRGYSVVLGAVESALVETVALTSCVVVADGEEGEEKHLVAYIVRAPPEDGDTRLKNWSIDTRTGACPEIRRAVDGALPHYMVPSVFIEVETLPVNAVGAKLDRKALQNQSADRRAMLRSLQLSAEAHATLHTAPSSPARWKGISKYLRVPPGSPLEDIEAIMLTLWEVTLDREPGTLEASADFHENGGHSLSAARLASLVNKAFSSSLSAVQLMRGMTVHQACQVVMASWEDSGSETSWVVMNQSPSSSPQKGTATEDRDSKILQQVKDASILPNDVVPKTDVPPRGLAHSKTIFLTGATGFLGAHVLAELLRKYPLVKIMCVIRSGDKESVQKNLERYKLLEGDQTSRIISVKGDLSQPRLGLDESAWAQATGMVDAVVHCGAAVSLTAPYSMLEAANVKGTLEVIRLCCACKSGAPLLYVSSNGIFPRDKGPAEVFLENDDIACLPGRLGAFDGYGLSKWAAERLVATAGKLGLPCISVRFGNLGWQTTTGIGNTLDFQGMILNGSRRVGARPNVQGWVFEATPVDFAASALVALADEPTYLEEGRIFNCVQAGFVGSDQVFDWVSATDGVTYPAVAFEEWVRKIQDTSDKDTELAALEAFVVGVPEGAAYLSKIAYLDCSKFDDALAELSFPAKRVDQANAETYFRTFLVANPVIASAMPSAIVAQPLPVDPACSDAPAGLLANKVAVVTGASSGIGKAIVLALVEAGCHVAMGARRLEELQKVQKEVSALCPGSGVKTLCVRTDVTKRDDVVSLVKATEVSLGPVDVIVNCAGVMYFTLMKNVLMDQWDTQVDVNCKGTMYGIGAVLPSMLQRGTGHIVNITSDAGRKSFPGLGVYSGTKFFVEAMSQALRAETASTGLRVTCIQPGNVETPLLAKSTDPEGLAEYGTPTGAKVLEPADIGRAVVYALSQPEWCAVNEILVEPREEPA